MEIGHLRGFNNSVKWRLSAPLRNGRKPDLKGALFVCLMGTRRGRGCRLMRTTKKARYLQVFRALGHQAGGAMFPLKSSH